jgi:hypothetical protein
MYVCMYVCMCAYVCVCVCLCVRTWMWVSVPPAHLQDFVAVDLDDGINEVAGVAVFSCVCRCVYVCV